MRRLRLCEEQLVELQHEQTSAKPSDFSGLAEDLAAAWNAPTVTMSARQQLLRSLVNDIVADVDEEVREIVQVIHWRGGQHSMLRVPKPRSGGPRRP